MEWLSLWYPLALTACLEGALSEPSVCRTLNSKLETCAPELINAVTFCPSTVTDASLDCPIKQAITSRFKKGWLGSLLVCLSVGPSSYWPVLVQSYSGNVGAYCWQGVSHLPLFPPGLFKTNKGVGHSLAIWAQPWNLKHWREWVSVTGCTLPLTLGLWLP